MKVKDYMQTNPVTIRQEKPVREALRMLFNLQIGGLVVRDGKKLAGIVTREDILRNLFPTLTEYVHGSSVINREEMLHENLLNVIGEPIKKYMITDVVTVTPATTLMKAQSLMLVNNFSHLPVTDSKGHLIGIITQGDIFKGLVSTEVPFDTDEEYHDWLAYHWDLVQRKRARYSFEAVSIGPRLPEDARVLDVGSGTAGHALELGSKGFHVTALEKSKRMHERAVEKLNKASALIKKNVDLVKGESYAKSIKDFNEKFAAVLYMGNVFSHEPELYKANLKASYDVLGKGGMLILQIANAEKILKTKGGYQDFNVAVAKDDPKKRYAFLEFYEKLPTNKQDIATLNMVVLLHNGNRWVSSAVNSMSVSTFTPEKITAELKKVGFDEFKIQIFGSNYGELLFNRPFNPADDDLFNIIAIK